MHCSCCAGEIRDRWGWNIYLHPVARIVIRSFLLSESPPTGPPTHTHTFTHRETVVLDLPLGVEPSHPRVPVVQLRIRLVPEVQFLAWQRHSLPRSPVPALRTHRCGGKNSTDLEAEQRYKTPSRGSTSSKRPSSLLPSRVGS